MRPLPTYHDLLMTTVLLTIRAHWGQATLEEIVADVRVELYLPVEVREVVDNAELYGLVGSRWGYHWVTEEGYKLLPVSRQMFEVGDPEARELEERARHDGKLEDTTTAA